MTGKQLLVIAAIAVIGLCIFAIGGHLGASKDGAGAKLERGGAVQEERGLTKDARSLPQTARPLPTGSEYGGSFSDKTHANDEVQCDPLLERGTIPALTLNANVHVRVPLHGNAGIEHNELTGSASSVAARNPNSNL